MKTIMLFSLLILTSGFEVFSQNLLNPEEERTANQNFELGNNKVLKPPVPEFRILKELHVDNQVFVQQIGYGNYINANTSTENSNLSLLQTGNENYISFIVGAVDVEGMIQQEGNYNASFDFTVNSKQNISANLIQKGDNLHFERYGANSIGNRLKFTQTGDSKSIIVRNFE
jgi:hypothetical protein